MEARSCKQFQTLMRTSKGDNNVVSYLVRHYELNHFFTFPHCKTTIVFKDTISNKTQ